LEASPSDIVDPEQRAAALDRARGLMAALRTGPQEVLDPEQRATALDRARGLMEVSSGRSSKSIEELLRLARSAYSSGRLSDAEDLYRQVLEGAPGNRVALTFLCRIYQRQKRWADTAALATRLSELQPTAAEPRELLARALLEDGHLEGAAAAYEALRRLQPDNVDVLQVLGRLYGRLQDWPRACTVLGELVDLEPSQTQPRVAYGRALQQAGDMAGAETQLEAVLQKNPREPDALALLGRLWAKSQPQRAVECWQTLAKVRPELVEPPLQLARLSTRHQRLAEAQEFYSAVIERDPGHVEALSGLGHVLATTDRDQAIKHFTAWAERRPELTVPRLELARLYQHLREWDHAEALYREILEHNPRDQETLSRFAHLLSRDPSRLEHALDLWRQIGVSDPTSSFPYVQRATLLERARRQGEAEAEYRAAIERAPADQTPLIGLARLLSSGSNPAEAAELFATVHRLNPRRPDALLGLGRTLERLEKWNEALSAYEKVLELDGGNANALLYRGRLLRRVGRIEDSIAQWRRVSAMVPQNADAWHELVYMLATAEREGEALEALDAAEAALEPSARIAARLANTAAVAQFHDRAVRYFERAIAAEPTEAVHFAQLGQYYFQQGVADGAFHYLLDSRDLRPADLPVAKRLVEVVHALNDLGIDHVALRTGPRTVGEILLPERLFGLVHRIVDHQVPPYDPVRRRIAVVSASLAPGGAERQVVNMLRGLAAQHLDLDLSLFCISLSKQGRRDFYLPMLDDTGVDVVVYDPNSLRDYLRTPEVAPYARLIRRFPEDMVGPIAHWLIEFRRRRPEVVHAWQDSTNLTAVVAALLAGVPRIILCTRSVRPDNPRRRLKRFMQDAYRTVLAHPSVVLSNNSRAGANDYADWLGLEPKAVEVVYNGIDFDKLEQSVDLDAAGRVRTDLGIPLDAPILGSAFRMSEEKRPSLWVEVAGAVARQDPRVHFIVCGDGPERRDMSELAARLGIADRLHLPGPQTNIASWYKAMDVVMLTSRHEGLPNVLLEAQCLGVPVVAPDVGGMSETVWQGTTGWTIKDANAALLAERVLHCIANVEWRQGARAAAPSFVKKRFGMQAMLQRTLEVYGISGAEKAT
jgi:glycosyltransferase involved in cell wall biosynthesis/tetratricopeptide (TPR) repeat protein